MAYNQNTTISGLQNDQTYMPTNFPTKDPMRDYPIYQSNYYTGSDISIYFGDTWVDEITAIQFQMKENVAPIYGYADYLYAKLARGNRIVQGKFRINFTEAGYLEAIIKRLKNSNLESIPDVVSREAHLIQSQTVADDSFDAFVKKQETAIWGEAKDTAYQASNNSASLSQNTFDIIIGYGATSGADFKTVKDYAAPTSTLQILKNVTISGKTQVIDTSDNIIQEDYDFVAQDVIISI